MNKTTTTAYTFTPDDLGEYVKSIADGYCGSDDITMGGVKGIFSESYQHGHECLIAFCERRDALLAETKCKQPEPCRGCGKGSHVDGGDCLICGDPAYVYISKPELGKILPSVPEGLKLGGRVFIGKGKRRLRGKPDLLELHRGGLFGWERNANGCATSAPYAIDPTAPRAEVDEALARFGLAPLDQLWFAPEMKQGTDAVQVLFRNGEEAWSTHSLRNSLGNVIGWRPAGGIGGAS